MLVAVTDLGGRLVPGAKVGVIEQLPGGGQGAVYDGRTSLIGRWQTCGLNAGQRVRVGVFGPRGALLGGKQTTLSSGQNVVELRINRTIDPDEQPLIRKRAQASPLSAPIANESRTKPGEPGYLLGRHR